MLSGALENPGLHLSHHLISKSSLITPLFFIYKFNFLININIKGYKNGVDAIVEVQVGDLRKTSKVAKTSNDPIWNDEVTLPVEDGSTLVDLTVRNSSLVRNIFLGYVRYPIYRFLFRYIDM